MKRRWVIILSIACAVLVAIWALARGGDDWTREAPLTNVSGFVPNVQVKDGRVVLPDGRMFLVAGVDPSLGVDAGEFEAALRVACAQGVVVTRDLKNGTACLRVEPRFYNWCGTRDMFGSRWAGGYIQVPLSEFLIVSGYGTLSNDLTSLTPIERWRLEGAASSEVFLHPDRPKQRNEQANAFSYDGNEQTLTNAEFLDSMIEEHWKAKPDE